MQKAFRSVSAVRNTYCAVASCEDRHVRRGDRIASFDGRAVHLNCVDAYNSERRNAGTQAQREIFWTVPCPACGSAALEACRTEDGVRLANHRARVAAYSAAKKRGLTADASKLAALRAVRSGLFL